MSWEGVIEVVSPEVVHDAEQTAALLRKLRVPHALIGGLAVGIHGYPRATKDVDFLVGMEALDPSSKVIVMMRPELQSIHEVGKIDLLVPDEEDPARSIMEEAVALPEGNEIPVVSAEVLVFLKLKANRPRDRKDIEQLLIGGNLDLGATLNWLEERAPAYVQAFSEIVQSVLDDPTEP